MKEPDSAIAKRQRRLVQLTRKAEGVQLTRKAEGVQEVV